MRIKMQKKGCLIVSVAFLMLSGLYICKHLTDNTFMKTRTFLMSLLFAGMTLPANAQFQYGFKAGSRSASNITPFDSGPRVKDYSRFHAWQFSLGYFL